MEDQKPAMRVGDAGNRLADKWAPDKDKKKTMKKKKVKKERKYFKLKRIQTKHKVFAMNFEKTRSNCGIAKENRVLIY